MLTAKQKRFAEEYLIDLNATQAALRAGYSPKTAHAIGNENLTKLEVRKYIDKSLQETRSAKIADVQEVMEYLSSVMRREKTESVIVKRNDGTEVVKVPAKLSDANKAAELLGKRYSIFSERLNIEGNIELTQEQTALSEILQELRGKE